MTAICAKCGRDCVTKLALGKHEAKGCEGKIEGVVLTSENHNPEDWKPIEGRIVEAVKDDPAPEWPWPKDTYVFSDRHVTKVEKCPKCCEIWADFLILDENTWVCLQCGCHFMPRAKMDVVNEWKLRDAERKRTENS